MNWGRAKTILIFMFLITDLFLFVILLQTKTSQSQIPAVTIEQTVSILSNHEIFVSPDMIPSKRMKNQNILMENFFAEPQEAAKKILGENVIVTRENEEAYEFQFSSETGELSLTREGFVYQYKAKPQAFLEVQKTDKIAAMVTEALDEKGILKNTFAVIDITPADGFYTCRVIPVFDKKQIYGVSMNITLAQEGIIHMAGNWFYGTSVAKDQGSLLDVTAVLAEMIFHPEQAPLSITGIQSGYYVAEEYLGSREISAVPIYLIQADNGAVYTYDARVGGRIE